MRAKTINMRRGAFGQPGVPFLLSRRAHLLTTCEASGGIAYGNRALSEGDAASAEALWTMPHTCSLLSLSTQLSQAQPQSDCLVGYGLYPILRQLPAKTCHRQLYRRYGRLHAAHFLFAKKKQKPSAKGR